MPAYRGEYHDGTRCANMDRGTNRGAFMLNPSPSSKLPIAPAIPGSVPAPLLSSRSRGWNGIVVELQHFRDIDMVVPVREHIIGAHIAGSVNLRQSRHGRSCVRHVRAGDVTITPSGEPKHFQHGGENVVILLKLDPAFVQRVAETECAVDPARVEINENFGTPDSRLVMLGKRIVACLELEGEAGRLQAESLTFQVASHLLRHYGAASMSPPKTAPRLSPRNLRRALDYIDENLREGISLADIARALSMSPGHFAHAFRQTTGLPPHRFVLQRRIEQARTLLRETDLPMTEIAYRIGCSSHSQFSVLFRRVSGQRPRDYRNQV
jgi:AraC family transcriptional regulator